MSDGVRLRRYEPCDAAAAWTLHERALRDAGTDPDDVPGTDDLRDVPGTYLADGGEFLVGIDPDAPAAGDRRTRDGALVAMGGFLPGADGAAELRRIRVAPRCQRRGHGRRLVTELERRAADRGFERVVATTAARQRAAVAFYRSMGYDEVDRTTAGGYELVRFERRL
ncbi:MAG: GNAT family N-acetyltransferase [Haloferacaceae archaeon]